MKKTSICFLTIIFMLTVMACANVSAQSFSDVNAGDWFYEDVELVKQDGIMQGYEDGLFRPYDKVTIGEVNKVAAEMLAEKNGEQDCLLNDIEIEVMDSVGYLDGHWAKNYTKYLMSGAYTGVVYLYTSTLDEPARRAEALGYMASVLYGTDYEIINDYLYCKDKTTAVDMRAYGISLRGKGGADINDSFTEVLYTSGVAVGDSDGYFNFNDDITRAEFASIISRVKHPERRVRCDVSQGTEHRKYAMTQRSYYPVPFYFVAPSGPKINAELPSERYSTLRYYTDYTRVETLYGNNYGCSTQKEYDDLLDMCYEAIEYADEQYKYLTEKNLIPEGESVIDELGNKKRIAQGYLMSKFKDKSYVLSEKDTAKTARDLIFATASKYYPLAYRELSELVWQCMGYRTGHIDVWKFKDYVKGVAVDIDGTYCFDCNGLKPFDEFKAEIAEKGADVSKLEVYLWSVPDEYIKKQ